MAKRKPQLTIDCSENDVRFVDKFLDTTRELCDFVEEMFVTTPASLLSPIFRNMIIEKAHGLKTQTSKLLHRLRVDNPGEDLE